MFLSRFCKMVEACRFSGKRSKLRKDQPRKLFPAYQSGEFLCGKLFNPRSLKAFTKLTLFFWWGNKQVGLILNFWRQIQIHFIEGKSLRAKNHFDNLPTDIAPISCRLPTISSYVNIFAPKYACKIFLIYFLQHSVVLTLITKTD